MSKSMIQNSIIWMLFLLSVSCKPGNSQVKPTEQNKQPETTKNIWKKTGANFSKSIEGFAVCQNQLLAITDGAGMFVSSDNGNTWNPSAYPQRDKVDIKGMGCILSMGDEIFVGTGAGMFKSPDNGKTWKEINQGFHPTLNVLGITSVKNNIYAGSLGIFKTSDGNKWVESSTGIPRRPNTFKPEVMEAEIIYGITSDETQLIAGSNKTIYQSMDNGKTWKTHNNFTNLKGKAEEGSFNDITICGSRILAATDDQLYISKDRGEHWNALKTDVKMIVTVYGPGDTLFSEPRFYSQLYTSESNVFGVADGDLMVSKDQGDSWRKINTPAKIHKVFVNDKTVFIGSYKGEIWTTELDEIFK